MIFANTTGSTYTKYWSAVVNTGVVHHGRRIMWLNKSDFSVGAGTPTWDNIARMEISWRKTTRTTTVVPLDITINGLAYGARHQTPTLIWTFDDGDLAQYSEAYLGTTNPASCMSAYGWPGTAYINSSNIGTSGKMTVANLRTLEAAGWDICSHTHSHIPNAWQYTPSISGTTLTMTNSSIDHGLTTGDSVTVKKLDPIECIGTFVGTMADQSNIAVTIPTPEATTSVTGYNSIDHITQAALRAEIQACLDWLKLNGFTRALEHYAYPYGYHSQAVVDLLQSMGFKTARTLGTMTGSLQAFGWSGLSPSSKSFDWFRLPARGLGSADTAAGVLTDIDSVSKYGGAIIIYGHNFVTAPAVSREFSIANLKTLFDGVKQREREGRLQIKTMREYHRACVSDAA